MHINLVLAISSAGPQNNSISLECLFLKCCEYFNAIFSLIEMPRCKRKSILIAVTTSFFGPPPRTSQQDKLGEEALVKISRVEFSPVAVHNCTQATRSPVTAYIFVKICGRAKILTSAKLAKGNNMLAYRCQSPTKFIT